MIDEVTESLEAFLSQPSLPAPLRDAAIRFDRPTDPYSIDQTTVNLFLYEVRENLELRSNEPVVSRVSGQVLVEPPAYRANCLYVVTAWPVDGTDLPKQEHRLLGQILSVFAKTPTIPEAFLSPGLQQQQPPLPLVVVQPDNLRNPAEFWAAIGNRIKPSVLLSVTVSLPTFDASTFPIVVSSETRWKALPSGAAIDAPLFRIAGTVVDGANVPIANAGVRILERNRSTLTDVSGRFSLAALPAGAFTLSVSAGALTKNSAVTVPAAAADEYDVQVP